MADAEDGHTLHVRYPFHIKRSSTIGLTIKTSEQLMVLGKSMDFGYCKGTQKSTGRACTNYVDK